MSNLKTLFVITTPPSVTTTTNNLTFFNEYLNINNNNNNNTMQHTRPSATFSTIIITCYCIIFLLGIIGNSLVVYVVCRNKSMQSVTNVFITNLAVSDILMCLLCVPFTPISFFMANWIFGKFLCHLVPFSLGVCVYVSTLTSLAIAIDRYFVIVHPFKPRMKLGVCLLLIAVVWIVAVSISLPLAIYVKFTSGLNTPSSCVELWPQQMLKRFFDLASLVLQYLIPFTVITYSYTKIWIILSKRTRPGKTKEKEQIELKRKKRTNRMLVAMVAIFAGCWMPLNIVHLIMEFKKNFTESHSFSTVFFIAHVIAMSSTVYNPFLYAWLNDNFRKEFRSVIPCVFKLFDWCRSFRPNSNQINDDFDEEENRDHSKIAPNQLLMAKRASETKNNHLAETSTCIDYLSKCSSVNGNSSPIHDEKMQSQKTTKFSIPPASASPTKKQNSTQQKGKTKNHDEKCVKLSDEKQSLLNKNLPDSSKDKYVNGSTFVNNNSKNSSLNNNETDPIQAN